MRDMLGFASHVEVCGIAGICGICGTDHLLEITPAGLPFLGPPPPLAKAGDRNGKRSTSRKKRMLILYLTC